MCQERMRMSDLSFCSCGAEDRIYFLKNKEQYCHFIPPKQHDIFLRKYYQYIILCLVHWYLFEKAKQQIGGEKRRERVREIFYLLYIPKMPRAEKAGLI